MTPKQKAVYDAAIRFCRLWENYPKKEGIVIAQLHLMTRACDAADPKKRKARKAK